MNGPLLPRRISTPSERLAHFRNRPRPRTMAQAIATGLQLDPASRDAGYEDAKAGRPPAPKSYDDVLGYFAGYASGKNWRG